MDTEWPAAKLPLVPAAFYQWLPTLQLPGRATGSFNPNIAGGAMALFLLPAVSLLLWGRGLSASAYLIQDFSITGAGPGMFQKVVNLLYPLSMSGPAAGVPHAHNTFLQAAADFGIPGLIAHVALLLSLTTGLAAAVRQSGKGTLPALAVGFLAALLVYFFHGIVNAALYASQRTYVLTDLVFGAMGSLSVFLLTSRSPVGNSEPTTAVFGRDEIRHPGEDASPIK